MKKKLRLFNLIIFTSLIIVSCNQNKPFINNGNENNPSLSLEVNGEDFVRQGFVSKDGWKINFNHVYVTLNHVKAYQTNPPFSVESNMELSATESLNLVEKPITIDLAEGDENATPILVSQVKANSGFYNAISWQVIANKPENSSIILDGMATKNNQIINFNISLNPTLNYICGEFIGEERKGIVSNNESATLEVTFHFDHIFGVEETLVKNSLNESALGFQPLANLSKDGQLTINDSTLQQKLTIQEYQKLQTAIASLGHVGEGHCKEVSNTLNQYK